jgi:very-short-patch-repair endonuclease
MGKRPISRSQYLQYRDWTRAAKLRHKPTDEELHVWRYLQDINRVLPEGVVWFRQCCVGRYIVDFLCPKAKLGLEVDGSSHYNKAQYDRVRQHFLEHNGYEILHISNVDTYSEDILAGFMAAVEKKTLFRLNQKGELP